MTTRVRVLSLYRNILRTARTWQGGQEVCSLMVTPRASGPKALATSLMPMFNHAWMAICHPVVVSSSALMVRFKDFAAHTPVCDHVMTSEWAML
jgi:hypothetical protein